MRQRRVTREPLAPRREKAGDNPGLLDADQW